MKDEISAAVLFLTRLIGKNENLNEIQIEEFKATLNNLLIQRFKNHWFPDKPFKGQGYRCIRVNEMDRKDPILERAAQECGLKYEDLKLPVELTIWVDPTEVCCRFGEHKGSYCTVASFKEGDKENFVNHLNVEEMELASNKRPSWDKDKRVLKKPVPSKSKTIANAVVAHTPLQQAQHTYCHPPASYQQAYPHYGSSPPSFFYQYLPITSVSNSPIATSTFTSSPYRNIRINRNRIVSGRPGITTFPQLLQPPIALCSDRYHWVNKALVKSVV